MGLLDADKIQRMEAFGEDAFDLLRVIEASFEIEFTEDDLVAAVTIGLLGRCISHKLLNACSRSGGSSLDLFAALRELIASEIGMKAERITAETRFPEGLNIY